MNCRAPLPIGADVQLAGMQPRVRFARITGFIVAHLIMSDFGGLHREHEVQLAVDCCQSTPC